jgi:hypothetical protein
MIEEVKQVPYQQWGPWRNQWGYETTIACFDDEDIIVKTVNSKNVKVVIRFADWESCEEFIELIEQDRRF